MAITNPYEEAIKYEWWKYSIRGEQRVVYDDVEYIVLPHLGVVSGVCNSQVGWCFVVLTNTTTLFQMGIFELLFYYPNLIIQTYDEYTANKRRYFILRKNDALLDNSIVSCKYSADVHILKTNEVTSSIIRIEAINSILKNFI